MFTLIIIPIVNHLASCAAGVADMVILVIFYLKAHLYLTFHFFLSFVITEVNQCMIVSNCRCIKSCVAGKQHEALTEGKEIIVKKKNREIA